jgi:hypothetical protein
MVRLLQDVHGVKRLPLPKELARKKP